MSLLLTFFVLVASQGNPVAAGGLRQGLLAEITASNATAGGVLLLMLTLFGALLHAHFSARKYIREQAGVPDTTRTEIVNQPLTFRAELEFVPMQAFRKLESEFLHMEATLEKRREDADRQFDELRDKLDKKFAEAITANNSSASKVHQRLDSLGNTVGEMSGKFSEVKDQLGEIRRILLNKAMGGHQ